jgi:hypothetical protein
MGLGQSDHIQSHFLKWKQLNMINLEQRVTDNINQKITLANYFLPILGKLLKLIFGLGQSDPILVTLSVIT